MEKRGDFKRKVGISELDTWGSKKRGKLKMKPVFIPLGGI